MTIAQAAILNLTRHLDSVIHSRMLLRSNGITCRRSHHCRTRENATSTGRRPRWSLSDPTVKAKLENVGMVAIGSTPEELAVLLKAETEKWSAVIKEANIALD